MFLQIYLAKYGMFIVEFICTSQGEKKLTAIVMWPCICHGNQTPPIEAQPRVKLILKGERKFRRHRILGSPAHRN